MNSFISRKTLTASQKKLLRNSQSSPARQVVSYNLWRDVTQDEVDNIANLLTDTPDELYETFVDIRSKTKAERKLSIRYSSIQQIQLLRQKAEIRKLKLEEHIRNISLNRQKPIIMSLFPVGFSIKDFAFDRSSTNIKPQKNIRMRKHLKTEVNKFTKLNEIRHAA